MPERMGFKQCVYCVLFIVVFLYLHSGLALKDSLLFIFVVT